MRYSFEILEARVLLSAVTIHVLDVTADPRFFAPVSSIAAKDGATVSAPANAYAPFKLHFNSLKAELSLAPREFTSSAKTPLVLRLPTPDGTLERFNVVDAPIMEAGLASEFPQVRTFRGVGIDDPSASVRLDYTPLGFHAQVLGSNGRYYIDPYYLNDVGGTYVSYYRRDLPLDAGTRAYDLDVGGKALDAPSTDVASQVTGDVSASLVTGTTLRTFRAAVAADGEYVGAAGGGTVVGGLSAVTTAMNRVVGVYETELAVRMVLVNAESSIIYTKAATDPYSNNSPSALLNQNQSNLDSVIGNANYDIGHVFSTGGGGLARLACVGQTGAKAQAETGLPNPTGDAFYIDYVAHEMGHQFGGNHTFNTSNDSGNRNGSTAYEPGSGSTIMAYAGIEGAEDLQPHSDPFFHAISLQEISTYLATIPGVGTSAATGNTPPTVSAGSNYTIPTGTPFALTATGSDPDGDPITFEWEEMDKGPATLLTTADNASSPLFRDWAPATSPTRTLPQLAGILSGTNQVLNASSRPVEKLYAAARTSNWRVIARDNRAGGGGVATSDMTLSVVNTGASFAVSTGNSSTTWTGGSSQTISWNVAGTTGSGINTANVKISLSSDGGNTFPTVLAASTPNDGSESLVIPNVGTTQARIKIEAVGNIFFDINNANLTIQQVQQQSTIPSGVTLAPGMDTGTSGSDNITNLNNSSGKTLQFVVSGTIPGALVKLYATGVVIGSATASGSTTTITPTGTIADNPYNMRATQTESGKSESNLSGITLVTIDTLAPSISVPASFDFEALPLQIIYGFSENVQPSLASSDVAITNSTNPQATIPGSSFLYTSATNKAQLQFAGVLPDGEYAAKITAADITDVAGNALASNDTFNFFFLAADGDRNEVVDISDFNILAVNFGTSAKTFSQGNYDYSADQAVTITDFNVLAIQFGKTTLSAGQTSVQALAVTESSSSSSGALPLRNDVNLLDDVGLV